MGTKPVARIKSKEKLTMSVTSGKTTIEAGDVGEYGINCRTNKTVGKAASGVGVGEGLDSSDNSRGHHTGHGQFNLCR